MGSGNTKLEAFPYGGKQLRGLSNNFVWPDTPSNVELPMDMNQGAIISWFRMVTRVLHGVTSNSEHLHHILHRLHPQGWRMI